MAATDYINPIIRSLIKKEIDRCRHKYNMKNLFLNIDFPSAFVDGKIYFYLKYKDGKTTILYSRPFYIRKLSSVTGLKNKKFSPEVRTIINIFEEEAIQACDELKLGMIGL